MAHKKKTKKQAAWPTRLATLLARNRRLVAIALIVLAVVLLAASAYGAQLSRQPENVVRRALVNTMQASSAKVSLQLDTRAVGQSPGIWNIKGTIAERGRFQLDGEYIKDGSVLNVDARSPEGRDAYVRMRGVDSLRTVLGAEAAQYGITEQNNPVSELNSVWLIVPADLKETIIWNRQTSANDANDLTDADRTKLAELYRKHEFLSVSNTFADADIDGVASYHYGIAVDSTRLRAFLDASRADVPKLGLSGKQIDGLVQAASDTDSIDVWIGKEDMRFSRVDYRAATSDDGDSLSLKLSDYDTDLQVRTPEGAVQLFEALTTVRKESDLGE
jgi:hypothetical protein